MPVASSGSSIWAKCVPSAPGCLPGFRPIARRVARLGISGLFGRPKRSDDGGSDEFCELFPTRFSKDAILRAKESTSDRSSTFSPASRSTSPASRSFSPASRSTSSCSRSFSATHLLGHCRRSPVEASGDVSERLARLQSDTNLLALVRAQYCTCHAGASNGSSLGWCRSS